MLFFMLKEVGSILCIFSEASDVFCFSVQCIFLDLSLYYLVYP